MSYYDTIDDDLTRAKEIVAAGEQARILGADSYAAHKLLESFVTEITRLRGVLQHEGIEHSESQDALIRAQAEITRLRALINAVGGEAVCTTALRLQAKVRTRHDDAG